MALTKHIPNAITSMNLLSGILGVIFALEGRLEWALPLMILAAVFDFCDGLAARLLNAYSPIGKELDSLADMVSFGVLPAIMLFKVQPLDAPVLLRFLPLFVAVMSALRLAKFNIDERQTSDFLGLPTPSCAMVCGSLAYFLHTQGGVPAGAGPWLLAAIAVIMGLLLVSEVPMFGMKIKKGHKLLDTKRIAFLVLAVACVLAVILFKQDWSLAILAVFSIYIAENLIVALINSCRRGA
ncbi:MAG: CDP-diacylglycerol--serine O-phosphatidyltransferase [Bacteroidales bacterium]|nr:CDP-diacylglycerol--serine O-phosphatidyltransferase [Bacteroidales bacterium]